MRRRIRLRCAEQPSEGFGGLDTMGRFNILLVGERWHVEIEFFVGGPLRWLPTVDGRMWMSLDNGSGM